MSKFTAVWDTGATTSVVTQAVVDQCGLKPIGTTTVSHAQGETPDVDVFLVNIGLPNMVGIPGLRVLKGSFRNGDVLIGMDIISQGDFAVTNSGNRTKFSFRIPSQADIDFLAEDRVATVLNNKATPSRAARQKNRKQRQKKKRG